MDEAFTHCKGERHNVSFVFNSGNTQNLLKKVEITFISEVNHIISPPPLLDMECNRESNQSIHATIISKGF